ncbi:MAG: hypothetical protein OEW95_09800 [Candidatus Bathyarchaeota archaeon]|nr:hypothetical protein [Candidatus Bathyarchaeota archaeon]
MTALQDYFDFVREYAPYFYYIPGTGVDPEWGKGPAAAAHAIDFLYECYYDSRFASSKTDIYDKIVALADYLRSIQWFPLDGSPSTVGTTSGAYPVGHAFQRECFFANGRFWVFYCDGTNMLFSSSADGTTWSDPTIVRDSVYGWRFCVFFDGTYVHYVYSSETNNSPLLYRRGTPNSDGTITWSAAEQTAVAGESGFLYYYPQITVDSGGYPWIGFYRSGAYPNKNPYVTKSSSNNGIWTTALGFPYQLNATSDTWTVQIVALTNLKVLALFARTEEKIHAKRWDGASWGDEITTVSIVQNEDFYSAVNQGDDVHLVFLKNNYDIIYVKYTYSTNSFGTEQTVQATGSATSAPVLSKTGNNDLYCFWAKSNHIYYKKCVNETWDTDPTDWIDESTDGIKDNRRIPCFYKAYGSYIGLVYPTKMASPYNVRFAAFAVSLNAHGGFKSRDDSKFYYSIDAHRAIPALLKAYDLTGTTAYLDAAKLAGGTFLYNTQHKPSELGKHDKYYGGFAQWVDIDDNWGPDMWIVDLYGLIGLKELYTRTGETKYQTMLDDSLEFYREGIKDLWLYYMPPPSGNGAWHRAPGVPPENLIFDDDYSYTLHALYLHEGWSETVEKVFRYCSEIPQSIDYPAYQPAVCWPGYLDVVNRKPDCAYYDAVTSGILALKLRREHDGIAYEYAKKILELHSDAFMYWGPLFTDYSPVENKKSVVTVSWLGLYLLKYSPVSNKFTQILNGYGENVTFYSVIPGETESFAEGVQIKAIVSSTRSGEIFLEPGYVVEDYITVYVFSPLKHHDKLVFKSVSSQVIGVQEFRFQGDVMYVKAFCRRLIT